MAWYRLEGRHDLPWRRTRDPYAVVISEVMLQQTQVERVLPYYSAWLARWPDFEALAEASPADVIEQWAGLGYNRRAVNLHRLAVSVVERFGGRLPRDEAELRALPGIGPYTASAVRSFAFEESTAVMDTNVGRALARVFCGAATVRDAGEPAVAAVAGAVLPPSSARDHNLALMDLGAMLCRARSPECGGCPVAAWCAWRLAGQPAGGSSTGRTERFEDTVRFARGRIVDALRGGVEMTTEGLAQVLPVAHSARVGAYLEALQRDGLVERDGRVWRLPR